MRAAIDARCIFGLGLLAGIRNGGYFLTSSWWCALASVDWDYAAYQKRVALPVFGLLQEQLYGSCSNGKINRLIRVLVCHFILRILNDDCSRFVTNGTSFEREQWTFVVCSWHTLLERRVHGARDCSSRARKLNKGLLWGTNKTSTS
jgi:hypothetical protein